MNADDVFDMREVSVTGIGSVGHTGILLICEDVFSPMQERHICAPSAFVRPGF